MSSTTRPSIEPPPEIALLVSRLRETMNPVEFWLFGSRARGDHRPDSDWDLLAVLADDAPDELLDPTIAWSIARDTEVAATILSTRRSDLESIWGLPTTLGYDLAREGVRLIER